MDDGQARLSKFRSLFWPIYRHELKKFVPMFFFFFFITFNYYILRILKDTYIITKSNAGAEVLPFLKVWAILPSAIFFTFLITFLAKFCNREKIFNIFLGIFTGFFAVFFLLIYPNQEYLHLHAFADFLQSQLPPGFQGLIAIIRYWSLTLFYVMSETWSTIMVSVLMWGFANEVIQIFEAKRFYALFSVATNLSGVAASLLSMSILYAHLGSNPTAYLYFALIMISAIIAFFLFKRLNTKVFSDFLSKKTYTEISELTNKKKYKMSFFNALTYLMRSKYLLCIAGLLFSYNLINNLSEYLMKTHAKAHYSSFSNFGEFLSRITLYTSMLAAFFSYFFSGTCLRRFGWRFTALITPTILFATGFFFFLSLFVQHSYLPYYFISYFGTSPILLTVFFGSMQNILSRACKFTFFDDTKEMAYIPLPSANKLKGKAAIDGIVSRLGKSGSAIVIQVLLVTFSSPTKALPYFALFIFGTFIIWGVTIHALSKKFISKTAAQAIAKAQSQTAILEKTEEEEIIEKDEALLN